MIHFLIFAVLVVSANAKLEGILFPDGSIEMYEYTENTTANTAVLTFGPAQSPDQLNGMKFHDFNTGYIASKLINYGVCLISSLDNKKAVYVTPKLVQKPPEVHFTITPKLMTTAEMTSMAGDKIVNFCDGYKSHLLVQAPITKRASTEETVVDYCAGGIVTMSQRAFFGVATHDQHTTHHLALLQQH